MAQEPLGQANRTDQDHWDAALHPSLQQGRETKGILALYKSLLPVRIQDFVPSHIERKPLTPPLGNFPTPEAAMHEGHT